MLRTEGNTLGMVAGRAGNHTACLLLVGELRYFIICASELERARKLQIFRLQINIGLRTQLGSRNNGRFARYLFKNSGCIEYFTDFKHWFIVLIAQRYNKNVKYRTTFQ